MRKSTTKVKRTSYGEGPGLLLALKRSVADSVNEGGDADELVLASMVRSALAHPRRRDALVRYLAAYLARTVSGSVPDPTTWRPHVTH